MNLANMIVGEDLKNIKNNIKKVFFYRICGTGMGACACLAKEFGLEVEGADLSFSPPMSTYLEDQKIPLKKLDELTGEYLGQFDLIIVGNSVPRQSEYARFVEESGVPFTSFPSFLGEFILNDKEVIGVTGTHGKTTTTYFLTQMLENLNEDPGYFIGGIIEGRAPSRHGGKYFIIEGDEYDSCYFQKISKFRLYNLTHTILTSLEFDHADIFADIEAIKSEFNAILPNFKGHIIANDDYKAIDDLNKSYPNKSWLRYGNSSTVGPKIISLTSDCSHFEVILGEELVEFKTSAIGHHNILNISACILLLDKMGFAKERIQESVKQLGMVKRRQEYRGKYRKAVVIDDFAHHPKAINLTIDAIKTKYNNKKIVTIFEPVSATARSSIFQKEFADSLMKSDKVIMAQSPIKTTVAKRTNLDCEQIITDLSTHNIEGRCVDNLSDLRSQIDLWTDDNVVLLVLSNRTCIGLWESDFVNELQEV